MGRYTYLLGILLLLCTFSSAHIVINSANYQDVASGVFYANVLGETSQYVYPQTNLPEAVLQVGPKQDITLIGSETASIVSGFESALNNNGAGVKTTLTSSDPATFNLELAGRSGADTFILTDPAYSYNLVVLFPYAKAQRAYVVFADNKNAGEVASFLSTHTSQTPLIYGTVDPEVTAALEENNIQFTQIDTGDKYLDNLEIVKKFFEKYDAKKQVVFADGTFFDPSITDGSFPVVLVSNTIPTDTYDFLYSKVASNELSVGVLVKGDYTAAVYDLMKTTNAQIGEKKFAVFVKMGETMGSGGEVQHLSVYPLPKITIDLGLEGLQYNTAKNEVELILENTGSIPTYVSSSVAIYSDGELLGSVGDQEVQLLAKGETKGFSFPFVVEDPGQLTGNLTTYYSSSKTAFEKAMNAYVNLGVVNFVDTSSIEVLNASYSPDADAVSVRYNNNGAEEVYFRTTIQYTSDISSSTIEDEEVRMLAPGQSTVVRMGGLLIGADELPTLVMEVTTEYGGREEFLESEFTTPVEILQAAPEQTDLTLYLLILIGIIILVIVLYFLLKKRGGKEEVASKEKKPTKASKN